MARKRNLASGDGSPLFKPKSDDVSPKTRLFLFVRAGGRCEFDDCNKYLMEHHRTRIPGIYAQMAHIWAFSPDGPRGNSGIDPTDLNEAGNLMLLCHACHKQVDDRPDLFPVEVLEGFKQAHEDRVFILTDTKPDRRTVAVALAANIGDQRVVISDPEMSLAAAPHYVNPRDTVRIDLTELTDQGNETFYEVARGEIAERVARLYRQSFEEGPATNFSVFALAPIPLLIDLGSRLSNKIPTRLFQRHRDTESWVWNEGDCTASYDSGLLREGTAQDRVALVVSLSGRIHEGDLPNHVDETFTVYEVALSSEEPNPRFLKTEADLRSFQAMYSDVLREIVARHEGVKVIDLFPATPAPVSVALGRDLLPKRDPALRVYDYDKRAGGFRFALEVNPHDSD